MKLTRAILLIFGLAAKAHAQTNALTLAEAKRLAFERNWDLLAAETGIDAAAAQLIVAKEFPNPNFSWNTAKIDSHGNSTMLGNNFWNRSYDTIFAVSQLFEIACKHGNRLASDRAGIAGARARFYDARRSLDQDVTKAYVSALLADVNACVLNESADSIRHEAEIAQRRFKTGDISESDLKRIENNAATFELQAKSAETAAMQVRISVEILMGVEQPKGFWRAVDSRDQLRLGPTTISRSKSDAARPDVLAAEAAIRQSRFDLKLQKAMRIPDPTFLVQYERNPPGPPGPDTMGVGISFPLPLWNWNRGNIEAAQAAADQAALTLEKTKAQAAADIDNAEVAYTEACNRWERYKNQIVPHAAKVRESVAFAYEKGGASLVDLLTAELDGNSIRLAAAQAMTDAVSAAADLIAARSVLSEAELNAAKQLD